MGGASVLFKKKTLSIWNYSAHEWFEPPNTQNEPLVPQINIENFAQYVELTAYPQRSALEPLLTERKV